MSFYDMMMNQQRSITENGAIGYSYSGNRLADLNFKVPTLRDLATKKHRITDFNDIMYEYMAEKNDIMVEYAWKWLLYLRDIRGGLGERESFRNILADLAFLPSDKFIGKIAEVGRWDDVIFLALNAKDDKTRKASLDVLGRQLNCDIHDCIHGEPVSLLGKWMPTINSKSKNTRSKALELLKEFKGIFVNERGYRKTMSMLRKRIDVVERKMSANEWDDIEYDKVPSMANIRYKEAFMKHDKDRRVKYLEDLSKGKTKINSSTAFPYDIVRNYRERITYYRNGMDETLEEMWKALPVPEDLDNFIVVRDGSASMLWDATPVPMDIGDALTIFCSEHTKNTAFKDKFITFSSMPKYVSLRSERTLADKIKRLNMYDDCSNTDIEAVFDLVLDTAKKNVLSNDKIPNILIISDMEFDRAVEQGTSIYSNPILFDHISRKWNEAGYDLPKLVFWNVASRTNTIPMTFNENGLILVSGFSQSLLKMVMSKEKSPWAALKVILDNPRYSLE